MPVNENGNYYVSIYGPHFEKFIAYQYYEKFKDIAIIEPNLRFFMKITPSVIDYEAEFDLFVNSRDGSVQIIECKARNVNEFDVNKFHILNDDVGINASILKFYSTEQISDNVQKLLADMEIDSEHIDLIELNKDNFKAFGLENDSQNRIRNYKQIDLIIKNYVKHEFRNEELEVYYKYNEKALFEHPGYYILLNDCWRKPYSLKQDIFFAIKEAMKLSIPKAGPDKRIILEFIFMKTCLLEKWHNPNADHSSLPVTRDFIKLIQNSEYTKKEDSDWEKRNEILRKFKNNIEKELDSNLIINDTANPIEKKKYFSQKYTMVESINISTLNVVVGMDRFILKGLSKAIYELHENLLSFNEINLIHTGIQGSIEATEALQSMLRKYFNDNKVKIQMIDFRDNEDEQIKPKDLINFINNKASSDAILVVTYIPKEWALYLHAKKNNWGYFFVIDRPEYSDPFVFLKLYNFD